MSDQITTGYANERAVQRVKRFNRSGGTVTRGQILMEDWAQSDGATTSNKMGGTDGYTANLITPATAGLKAFPHLVCDEDSIADDGQGWFILEGECSPAIVDDDVGNADVNKGDPITVANGVKYAQIAGSGERIMGTALEDGAAASDSSATQVDASSHRRRCYWVGGRPGAGQN